MAPGSEDGGSSGSGYGGSCGDADPGFQGLDPDGYGYREHNPGGYAGAQGGRRGNNTPSPFVPAHGVSPW
jgi:hypothetical protein